MRKILYKYRQWNDYTKEIFLEQQIYCPSPPQLNDPFDCKAGLYSHQIELAKFLMNLHICSFTFFYLLPKSTHFPEKKKKEISRYLNKNKGDTKKNFDYIQKTLLEINPYAAKLSTGTEYLNLFEKQSTKLGVFSLTEDPLNMLMWSHYGDQHQGLAIGFEQIKTNDLGNEDKCKQVIYSNSFPIADFTQIEHELSYTLNGNNQMEKIINFNINNPILESTFFHKARCWEYEKEWRLLEPFTGKRPLPGKIVQIIFGCKCDKSKITDIKKVIKEAISNSIQFYKIETEYNTFNLSLKRI